MLLKEVPLDKLYPGMRVKTCTGKMATLARADSRPEHFKNRGSKSCNNVTNDLDDDSFWIDIDGDDWHGHGDYWHLSQLEVIE